MKKTLDVYDFDGTITKKDSFNDFLVYTFGYNKFIYGMISNWYTILLYLLKKKTNAQMKTKLFRTFFKNITYDEYLDKCLEYEKNRLDEIIRPEFKSILENTNDKVILSASFKEYIEPWAKKYNFKYIICSEFKIKDNIIDGKVEEKECCHGKNKLVLLKRNVRNLENYDYIKAYGNSDSDKYYMSIADEKIMVKKNKLNYLDEEAIVTDGLWRKSISVIRSVGKMGVKVIVTGDSYLTTGMWSRYCTRKEKITNASTNIDEFGKNLLNILNEKNKPVLFPMEEPTIKWCCDNYDSIKNKCYTLLPSEKSMEIALNKSLTMKQAMKIKISCPKTYFPKNVAELKKIIKEEKLADYVIKPYRGSGSSGLLYGDTSKNVSLDEHWKTFGELILQERIPAAGEGAGVSIIMDKNSEVKGVFAHKRLEQYPNSGGPSTQRIGIKNQRLVDDSIRLLKSLNWVGVAMVEWKYNINTKEYTLMEINPRFWGSLELAVRSGVDFPFIYYQLAKKRNIDSVLEYDTSRVCRWLIPGDVLRYLTKKDREPFFKFCKGMFKDSEEWDKHDKRGFFASIICQALLVLNPKYWKYIRR